MSGISRRPLRQADVVLISMPFGELFSPSMGLSLLKGALNREGVPSLVRYFGIHFARRTGRRLYDLLSRDSGLSVRHLAGEWLFASEVFATGPEDDERYIADILRRPSGWVTDDVPPVHPATIRRLLDARRRVGAFLDDCAVEVLAARPRIVGFTSVFQQHVASLALAQRLKREAPDLVVLFGGSNCEGVMGAETARQFPFIDAVVSGESDLVFPEIVRRILGGASVAGIKGVHTRDTVDREFLEQSFDNAPAVRDMDCLPGADFDDFFDEFHATGFKSAWQPRLFFETSRGCWWGEKQHCTFCGLNGQTMTFRSKSAARVLDELAGLVDRYPGCPIQVVDNILDMRYFSDLLPALAERRLGVTLFYETKANLKKDHVRLLRAAGVTEIQPGIESFGDRVLELMRKGITGLQNIQLLKWCTELGVRAYWNVLWGFPGEPAEDYRKMAELAPLLTHLAPPDGIAGLRLDRFSPNFFDAGRLGFLDVRPLPAYERVYPLSREAVANLAYHFTFSYPDSRRVGEYVAPLLSELRAWRADEGRSALFSVDLGEALVIFDTRPIARHPVTVLSGIDRELYLQCDAVTDVRRLSEIAKSSTGDDSVVSRLEPLCDAGLLVRDDRRYLALAIPLGEFSPAAPAMKRLCATLVTLGEVRERDLLVRFGAVAGSGVQHVDTPPRRRAVSNRAPRFTRFAVNQFELRGRHELLIRSPRSVRQFTERSA